MPRLFLDYFHACYPRIASFMHPANIQLSVNSLLRSSSLLLGNHPFTNNASTQLCHPRLTTLQRSSIAFGATFRSSLSESPVFTTPFGSSKSTPTSSSAFGHCNIPQSVSSLARPKAIYPAYKQQGKKNHSHAPHPSAPQTPPRASKRRRGMFSVPYTIRNISSVYG